MEPVRCYCGFPISNVLEAFYEMRRIYLDELREKDDKAAPVKNDLSTVHIDFNMMDPSPQADMQHIFQALGMENAKYCCKKTLCTSIQFHDLEVQDRF